MNLDMVETERYNNLSNQVWEVGLAVLSHRGDCDLFRVINAALDGNDMARMETIVAALGTLPDFMQHHLLNGSGDSMQTLDAIGMLEEVLWDLLWGECLI